MATDDKKNGIRIGTYMDSEKLGHSLKKYVGDKEVTFLCIGTDKIIGDCLAPLLGTMLTELGYDNVVGTLDNPVHAKNLDNVIEKMDKTKSIIAIDAGLADKSDPGTIIFEKGKIKPGTGVGKKLTPVGDYSIIGIVNHKSHTVHASYITMSHTRLNTIMNMARSISKAIEYAFPLSFSEDMVGIK